MQNYNDEYFYVRANELEIYPTLKYASGGGDYTEISKEELEDTSTKRIVCFAAPIPEKPQLGDFHYLKQFAPVISERLKNVLESLNLKDVQFLPVVIRDECDNKNEGFYILHVYNKMKCLDKERSEWEESFFDEEKADIDKLVLDNAKIDKIPSEDRLVLKVWEDSTHLLFHESVVEKILEIAPTGLTIYRLSKYNPSLPFIEEYVNSLKNR